MRLGEVLGLQWQDVDWERKTISVRRSVQKLKGYGLIVKEPKTRHGRTIALSDQAISVLKKQRIGGYIFTIDGNPLDGQAVRRHFRRLLATASLPTATRLHDLRHGHASLLLAQNVHPKVVAERLGHANIGITLNIYSHLLPNLQTDAVQKLDLALAGPSD
jgi:integrase